MSFSPGQNLGPYTVVGPLGAGGMGEVYRARDRKLDRDVALKVLPDSFAADADRLARFTREAKTLAALNHTNIAHIHGIEESGGVRALVMELVEGEDLSERLKRGPIPIEDAIAIAKQIADALEAAHEQGVIHRDLKPANVKVRSDGTAKVLDFGLAKAIDPTSSSGIQQANSPTLTAHATERGLIIGTAAYMSPEQAKGRAVDRRADVWAFGVVFYEMLTGRRAFHGEDTSETLASVLRDTPDLRALPPETPVTVRHLIERCLDRDPRTRLRDIGEARIALSAPAAPQTAAVVPPVAPASRRWIWMAAAFVAGLAVAAAAFVTISTLRSSPPSEPSRVRFTLTPPSGSTLPNTPFLAISPDGRQMVFSALRDSKSLLWLRPLDGTDATPLAGTEGATLPFWSPDGKSLGFFAEGRLKKIEIGTGALQILAEGMTNPGGGSWSADNTIVHAPILEGPLFRVSASGGTPAPLTTLDEANGESNHMWPWFLPDGRRYVFQVFGLKQSGLYVGSLDSAERRLVVPQESLDLTAVAYTQGHLIYVRNYTLVAQPFDVDGLTTTGEPVRLADGFGLGGPGNPRFAVSQNGVLAYQSLGAVAMRQLTWFARSGTQVGVVGSEGPYGAFDLSPDGRTIVVERFTEKERSLWLMDVARGTLTRLTTEAHAATPRWAPDGQRIAFASVRDTPPNPFVRTLAGVEQRLARLPTQSDVTSWTPDGREVIGYVLDRKTGADLWRFSTVESQPPKPFIATQFEESSAQISPDGRYVAFVSDETGTRELYVTTFPDPGRRLRVSSNGGILPSWRSDGKELFFQQTGRKVMSVTFSPAASDAGLPEIGLARELFTLPEFTNTWIVTRDGQRFLAGVRRAAPVPSPIHVAVNWSRP